MPSRALEVLKEGLAEIEHLQRANPSPQQGGGLTRPQVSRAIGRSEVVLLSSHFEHYLYAINEEAVDHVAAIGCPANLLPEDIRLLHSRSIIDDMARMDWVHRGDKLRSFYLSEAPLWSDTAAPTQLDAERILSWMTTPRPKQVTRFFRYWGIPDIFDAITRTPVSRQRLWMRIDELVTKRNNIAHGDFTVEATYLDVVQYRSAVKTFCERADRRMSSQLARLAAAKRPW